MTEILAALAMMCGPNKTMLPVNHITCSKEKVSPRKMSCFVDFDVVCGSDPFADKKEEKENCLRTLGGTMAKRKVEKTESEDIDTSVCPNCDSDNIDAFDSNSTETSHIDNFSCADCEAQWDVVYELKRIENLKLADDEEDPDDDDDGSDADEDEEEL